MLKSIYLLSRIFIILFGVAATINAVALFFITNYNAGLAAALLVGIVLLVYGIFLKIINKLLPKWIKIAIIFILIVVLSFIGFLHISGTNDDENISEAMAMETYLVSNGVPRDQIIKEDRSSSTYENFNNSKAILDKHFQEPYTVAYVTNEYHVFRAGCVAKTAGLDTATHIHSSTKWYLLLPSTLRECLANVKFWLLKN